MSLLHRVLDEHPCESLRAYELIGGGRSFAAAQADPIAVLVAIERSGLRGRGGAGFPTSVKWRSVMANASESMPTTVVINAAEGEPSTFKDRTILRNNPYRVLEGAFVACAVVGATHMTVCLKESFATEWSRVREALDEMTAAGWANNVEVRMMAGPSAYLFGEETALLEVVEGRQPFPRVTPDRKSVV